MKIRIPLEKLTVRASRSGGPGGQNVNKVSSRVEVRFLLDEAAWIPPEVRKRLRILYPGRLSRQGEFRVVSSRFRNQQRNLKDCLEKISAFLSEAQKRQRKRILTAPTRSSREKRLSQKRRRAEIKRQRSNKVED